MPSPGPLPVGYPGPLDHDDPKLEPLREDFVSVAFELPRPDLDRDDGREQPDQRRALETHCARYGPHPHELGDRSMGNERTCTWSGCGGRCPMFLVHSAEIDQCVHRTFTGSVPLSRFSLPSQSSPAGPHTSSWSGDSPQQPRFLPYSMITPSCFASPNLNHSRLVSQSTNTRTYYPTTATPNTS